MGRDNRYFFYKKIILFKEKSYICILSLVCIIPIMDTNLVDYDTALG